MKLSKKQRAVGLVIHLPILPLTIILAILGNVSSKARSLDLFLADKVHSMIKKIK